MRGQGKRRLLRCVVPAVAVGAIVGVVTPTRVGATPHRPDPRRVAVPAQWDVVDTAAPATTFVASVDDGTLRIETDDGRRSVSLVSSPQPLRVSTRCGTRAIRQVTHSAGEAAVTVGRPPFLDLQIRDATGTIPAAAAPATLHTTISIPVRHLDDLVGSPSRRTTLERWSHRFDDGARLSGVLRGSLRAGFGYSLSAVGAPAAGSNGTTGMGCHQPGMSPLFGEDVTHYPFLVPFGQTASVDGKRIRDLRADPFLRAAWAVVSVGRGDPPRRITFRADGRRIDTSTVRFVSRAESGF